MSGWLANLVPFLLLTSAFAENVPPQAQSPAGPPVAAKPNPVDRSKEATTDLAQVDEDFGLQGEYMGRPSRSWLGSDLMGLQVVALGGGKFEASLLRGGLPGAGWDRKTRVRLTGERLGRAAILANDEFTVKVTGGAAAVEHKQGGYLGNFRKWHRISPTQDAPPPYGAIVLFDGTSTNHFTSGKLTPDRLLQVGAVTKMPVGDFQLHVEFRTPYMPHARGQGRGNSGIYVQQRYEVQVLDSFGLKGLHDECGGLYKQRPPQVNMCFPPLTWQTYDISFSEARWNAEGQKVRPARITVLHNGEPVHVNYELSAKTGGGKAEGPERFPILFQNHNNPVLFRNIWLVPRGSVTPYGGPVAMQAECEILRPGRTTFLGGRMTRGVPVW